MSLTNEQLTQLVILLIYNLMVMSSILLEILEEKLNMVDYTLVDERKWSGLVLRSGLQSTRKESEQLPAAT
jgi:hypothetical protein